MRVMESDTEILLMAGRTRFEKIGNASGAMLCHG
jgi:hypothetical protein